MRNKIIAKRNKKKTITQINKSEESTSTFLAKK